MAKMFDYVKNLFWLLLIVQFVPVLIKNLQVQLAPLWETKSKVGLITIDSVLTDSTTYVHQLRKFFEDKEIKAIMLKIESPGGAAGTSQAIFNEIKELKKNVSPKFVLALVENIAASGGYYIACAADYIIATPSAFIGSIGAYIPHPNVREFIEYHKLKYEIIKTGAFKSASSPLFDLSEPERNMLQSLTDNTYEFFVRDVAEQRAKAKLPADSKEWADGKIFTGDQALKLGLIDKLGSLSTAMEVLKEHAPIVGKIDWVKPPKKYSLLSVLSGENDKEDNTLLHKLSNAFCSVIEKRYSSQSIQV